SVGVLSNYVTHGGVYGLNADIFTSAFFLFSLYLHTQASYMPSPPQFHSWGGGSLRAYIFCEVDWCASPCPSFSLLQCRYT
ncbi:hypothetical protein COCCADRAFT_82717, partial [Bipolaris zeicola 26-R-13]